jgi:hypothetical protein
MGLQPSATIFATAATIEKAIPATILRKPIRASEVAEADLRFNPLALSF